MRHSFLLAFFFFTVVLFSSCDKPVYNAKKQNNVLTVASSHPLALITPIIENFENETGIDVTVVQSGTGVTISTLLRYPDTTPYDVMWGGSYTSVLPFTFLFADYKSSNENFIPDSYKNTEGMITRFSDVPSVLMINKSRLGSIQVEGYEDLLNPLLKGQIAFASPENSSSSWEHLINMLHSMGKGNYSVGWEYVKKLCENFDGQFLKGSFDVYDGVAKGKFAVGLTFEEGAANYAQNDENIDIVYMKEGVVFTPDGVYLLKNASHLENAKKFIDYVTETSVQNYISEKLNRRSVRNDIAINKLFPSKDSINCIEADYEVASKMQNVWLKQFRSYAFLGENNESAN